MKCFLSTAALRLLEDSDVDTIKANLKNRQENRFLSYIMDSSHSSSSIDHDLEDMIIEEEVAHIIQQRSNISRYKQGTRSNGYRKGNTYKIIDSAT